MVSLARLCLIGLGVCGFAASAGAQTLTFGTPNPDSTETGTAANGVTVVVSYTAGSDAITFSVSIHFWPPI